MDKYDCTNDVKEHITQVQYCLVGMSIELEKRIRYHDASKLEEPEKSMFDEFTPKLKEFEFGSDEYNTALSEMGDALKHHYDNNRHHPEHFQNGISGMTLIDLLEMVCDWIAAAKAKQVPIDMNYLSKRFGIGDQLVAIIINTLDNEYTLYGKAIKE